MAPLAAAARCNKSTSPPSSQSDQLTPLFSQGAALKLCPFSGAEKERKRHPPIPSPSLYGRDVTDSGQRPPYIRVLVWLAKPVPYGRAIIFDIPAIAAPWKGAHLRQKDSIKGTQKAMSFLRLFCAVAEKNSSRVPRYQNGRKSSVSAIFCVKPPNIGGGLEGGDVSLLLSLRQRK